MILFYDILTEATGEERNYLLSSPVLVECLKGDVSLEQYTAYLKEAYHHVKHTVPLLMSCGAGLSCKYEWLREAIAEYIEEEIGHQEWILNDLAVCGEDKERIRVSTPNINTEVMISYAYDFIHRKNPIGFFGMVYVLEGTSIALATQSANIIKEQLNLPDNAFSYLSSHGSLDIEHIEYFKSIVNRLDSGYDKSAIIHCAKIIYVLYANIFRALPEYNNVKLNKYVDSENRK
jgi:pyrroloquinoline quinone (PQQ) biosynthesis protein C